MKNPSKLFTVVLVFVASSVFGQAGTTEKITETFFKTFKQDPAKAYGDLFSDNKWMKDKKADIETIKIK